MTTIKEMIRQANEDGYVDDNAEAKVCQDVVLKAISESTLSRNVTIKGGVVMRSISKDARRATQDTRTPEDYSEYYSRVKANFESQWFHERTNTFF